MVNAVNGSTQAVGSVADLLKDRVGVDPALMAEATTPSNEIESLIKDMSKAETQPSPESPNPKLSESQKITEKLVDVVNNKLQNLGQEKLDALKKESPESFINAKTVEALTPNSTKRDELSQQLIIMVSDMLKSPNNAENKEAIQQLFGLLEIAIKNPDNQDKPIQKYAIDFLVETAFNTGYSSRSNPSLENKDRNQSNQIVNGVSKLISTAIPENKLNLVVRAMMKRSFHSQTPPHEFETILTKALQNKETTAPSFSAVEEGLSETLKKAEGQNNWTGTEQLSVDEINTLEMAGRAIKSFIDKSDSTDSLIVAHTYARIEKALAANKSEPKDEKSLLKAAIEKVAGLFKMSSEETVLTLKEKAEAANTSVAQAPTEPSNKDSVPQTTVTA